jgi:molybdate transport system permease protein
MKTPKAYVDSGRAAPFLAPYDPQVSPANISAILLTLKVASFATALVFLPGVLFGYCFARKNSRFTQVISSIVILPMVLPPTAVGYMLLRLMAVNGPLGGEIFGFPINLLLTWKAAVIASTVEALPLVVRTAKVAFEGVDHRLEQMARTLGHGPIHTFFRTSIPLASRGLLAAAILGFVRAVSEFGATITVAGNIPFQTQTLASGIFSAQQSGEMNEANVLIAIALILGFAAVYATEVLAQRARVAKLA